MSDDAPTPPDPSIDGFEFMPPPPEAMPDMTEYKRPDWESAPRNWLPGVAPLNAVIARTDDAVVMIAAINAYPVGFGFRLISRARQLEHDDHHGMFPPWHFGQTGQALPDDLLRFAFIFADGSSASSVSMPTWGVDGGPPAAPILMQGGGGGGGGDYAWDYWCWPLPPEGTIRVVCEWPKHGFDRVVTELDAGVIRTAADQAEQLWPDPPDRPDGQQGGVSVTIN
jgi:hypothetical protein